MVKLSYFAGAKSLRKGREPFEQIGEPELHKGYELWVVSWVVGPSVRTGCAKVPGGTYNLKLKT